MALALGCACLATCGRSDQAAKPDAADGHPSEAKGDQPGGIAAAPATPAVEAKPISLRSLALPEGAGVTGKSSAKLSYKTAGDARSAYEFQRKQLLARGWQELPGASSTAQSASGNFTGAGYKISLTVYSFGGPGLVTVMLNNHGNIDFATLPVPAGAKPFYAGGPLTASFITDASLPDTIAATRAVLLKAGWEAHGGEDASSYYKQGLNRILASIQSAPAAGGKTVLTYTGELMVGDLPAPPEAQGVRYNEGHEGLTFKSSADRAALTAFYREKLAPTGWKQDEDKTFKIDDYDQMGFFNAAGDVMFLKVWPERGGVREVALEYLSREAITEMDAAIRERKAKGGPAPSDAVSAPEPEAAPAPLPRIAITLPASATSLEKSEQRVDFRVPKGQGRAVVEDYRKQFKDAGWKEESAAFQPTHGTFACSKDGDTASSQRLFINYIDLGATPAQIKLSSFGAQLDAAAAR